MDAGVRIPIWTAGDAGRSLENLSEKIRTLLVYKIEWNSVKWHSRRGRFPNQKTCPSITIPIASRLAITLPQETLYRMDFSVGPTKKVVVGATDVPHGTVVFRNRSAIESPLVSRPGPFELKGVEKGRVHGQ